MIFHYFIYTYFLALDYCFCYIFLFLGLLKIFRGILNVLQSILLFFRYLFYPFVDFYSLVLLYFYGFTVLCFDVFLYFANWWIFFDYFSILRYYSVYQKTVNHLPIDFLFPLRFYFTHFYIIWLWLNYLPISGDLYPFIYYLPIFLIYLAVDYVLQIYIWVFLLVFECFCDFQFTILSYHEAIRYCS